MSQVGAEEDHEQCDDSDHEQCQEVEWLVRTHDAHSQRQVSSVLYVYLSLSLTLYKLSKCVKIQRVVLIQIF